MKRWRVGQVASLNDDKCLMKHRLWVQARWNKIFECQVTSNILKTFYFQDEWFIFDWINERVLRINCLPLTKPVEWFNRSSTYKLT